MKLREEGGYKFDIEVDGGLTRTRSGTRCAPGRKSSSPARRFFSHVDLADGVSALRDNARKALE
ncbi:MAG: hypothetical protein WDO13_10560 [Verrucomicrobiota bacterium]